MMHKSLCSIEEVPYCFSRSSIRFQGNTGWKIDNLNPIWVRLLGWSQLSNPSDLPCYLEGRLELATSGWVPELPGSDARWELPFLYPRPTKLEGGVYSIGPSVCPSVCRRHGFQSISQVCFGISISNFICMLMVAIGRSLLIFSDVTFKMTA